MDASRGRALSLGVAILLAGIVAALLLVSPALGGGTDEVVATFPPPAL